MAAVLAQALQSWFTNAQVAALAGDVPPGEVEWLLREVMHIDRYTLRFTPPTTVLSLPCSLEHVEALWQERLCRRTPLQYLVGKTYWRDFHLAVGPAVLIPRPETELMIDIARDAVLSGLPLGLWADLGTGSGAIALGLAQMLASVLPPVHPPVQVYAVDQSSAALAIAQQNAGAYALTDRITFLEGDWFAPLAHLRGQFAAVLSNPPYIPSAEVLELQPEVQDYEPHFALDGGPDGLADLRYLVAEGCHYLQSGGLWLVEHMAGQSLAVQQLLAATGQYHSIQGLNDLAGLDRFVLAYRN